MIRLPDMAGFPVFYDENETQTLAHVRGLLFHRIIVGPRLGSYSPAIQAAVMTHEVGHILLWHVWKRVFALLSLNLRHMIRTARRHEMEADLFAAGYGHGFALARLYRHTSKNKAQLPEDSAENTLIRRIGLLKQPSKLYRIRRILAAKGEIHGH